MNKRLDKGVIGNDMGGKGKSEQSEERQKVDTQVKQLKIIHHIPEKVDQEKNGNLMNGSR